MKMEQSHFGSTNRSSKYLLPAQDLCSAIVAQKGKVCKDDMHLDGNNSRLSFVGDFEGMQGLSPTTYNSRCVDKSVASLLCEEWASAQHIS
jgi:hypothetical protein